MIEWIKDQLHAEEIYASPAGIAKVIAGEPTSFEDVVVDLILSLKDEWDRD